MICCTARPSNSARQSETYSFLSADPSSRTPQLSKASTTLMSEAPWRSNCKCHHGPPGADLRPGLPGLQPRSRPNNARSRDLGGIGPCQGTSSAHGRFRPPAELKRELPGHQPPAASEPAPAARTDAPRQSPLHRPGATPHLAAAPPRRPEQRRTSPLHRPGATPPHTPRGPATPRRTAAPRRSRRPPSGRAGPPDERSPEAQSRLQAPGEQQRPGPEHCRSETEARAGVCEL
jgi:hypothetical protein